VVHQAGEKHLDRLRENYAAAGVPAHCVAFIDDMAGAYEWADLVICRAGALTVAELAASASPACWCRFPMQSTTIRRSTPAFCRQPEQLVCCHRMI
jgi:UDP-N-acetylglucosamine--N-acetylmuramyl-(pentapeptide) pyrophosphoryl-undecaprenol N-acetylglucosamine transferase